MLALPGRYLGRVWFYCRLVSVGGVLLEQVQLKFSFRNKFIIVHPCGLPVDNKNTFSKMRVFKSLTGSTDGGGYGNRNACVLIIIK
jgi:hypothetical protein